jgi:hypothetical protein
VASILEMARLAPCPTSPRLKPPAEEPCRSDIQPTRARALNLLVDNEAQAPSVRAPRRMGSSFWGEKGPWPQWGRVSPMNENGWRASTPRIAGANTARSIRLWTRLPVTSGRWSSPQAVRVTAPCCRACWIRSHPMNRSVP